jgi:hypothetical protein
MTGLEMTPAVRAALAMGDGRSFMEKYIEAKQEEREAEIRANRADARRFYEAWQFDDGTGRVTERYEERANYGIAHTAAAYGLQDNWKYLPGPGVKSDAEQWAANYRTSYAVDHSDQDMAEQRFQADQRAEIARARALAAEHAGGYR